VLLAETDPDTPGLDGKVRGTLTVVAAHTRGKERGYVNPVAAEDCEPAPDPVGRRSAAAAAADER